MSDDALIQELRRTLGRMDSALSQISESLVLVDAMGKVLWSNAPFEQLIGKSRIHILGVDLQQLLPKDCDGEPLLTIDQARGGFLATGSSVSILNRDPVHALKLEWRPVVTEEPNPLMFSIRDISASVELEATNQMIEQQKIELQRSNKELQHFAYVASHDLQEPLRTVQSYLQLLRRRYQPVLDQDAEEFIDFAINGAARMRELIEDLLTYARVASRARPLQPERLDDILDEVLFSLKVRLEEQGAVVERGCLPTVMADRRQLAQLMQNLISNAVKFQNNGSKPVVQISAEQQDERWLVRVKDNGIGIEQDYQEKIFVIFQRLHARDEYEGTGVGLAVCKKIVERHGGSIWVESQPNQGATFLFTLPDVQTSSSQIPLAVNELSCHDSQSDLTG